MEAILEATSRDSFGKNEAQAHPARRDWCPAVLYGTSEGPNKEATAIAVASQGAAEDSSLGVGREHA